MTTFEPADLTPHLRAFERTAGAVAASFGDLARTLDVVARTISQDSPGMAHFRVTMAVNASRPILRRSVDLGRANAARIHRDALAELAATYDLEVTDRG